MADFTQLEATYQEYIQNLSYWIPDGIITVDLHLIQRLGLWDRLYHEKESPENDVTNQFHVIESPEKITLFNDRFVVWIVPELNEGKPITYALIAINKEEPLQLELAFSAEGVYNSSRTVLRVLEKFLEDIEETEDLLKNIS